MTSTSKDLATALLNALSLIALALPGTAQQFTRNTSDIPSGSTENGGFSENVDFGDVDLDGDWDAVIANGGDGGNQQDRIWINMGGAQGGTIGTFEDQTDVRFPALATTGRDIEFVDVDNDGDLDIYGSVTSQISSQPSRWWINMGGAQGGSLGFYQEQTQSRWVNLGGPGSSIYVGLVLPGGGFIDWSCDSDFGDLDNDGDLDLVHSSYGGSFGGLVPTRLFLNDGDGFFEEFNPSGYQLTGSNIDNGEPGLWSEGTQSADTTSSDGTFCDIASSALDIDIGDIDGDLDIDILHGARQEPPRMFENRLEENGGTLTYFRDVTGAAFPPNYSTGTGHYEQELGDLDQDNDLDIYGLNWRQATGSGFRDITIENDGSGTFTDVRILSNSQSDDNEGDLFDYDNDGDLDLFVANFSGQNRLYRNDTGAGGIVLDFTSGQLPSDNTISLDADCCDVDGDGDYDVFVCNDVGVALWYLENGTGSNDISAARVANLEQAPDRSPGSDPTVVRVQVYDNSPYYIAWYNTTTLEYSIDGSRFTTVPMRSSGGQIFRGEIPGNLSGTICYRVRSADEYGNTGLSGTLCYDSPGDCDGNISTSCTAKQNSCDDLPAISSTGMPSASASSGFVISASGARMSKAGLVLYTENGRAAIPFQGGLLCVAPPFKRAVPVASNGGLPGQCDATFDIDWNAFASGNTGGNPAPFLRIVGQQVNVQWWGRDTIANGSFLSDGLEYTVCP